MCQVDDCEVMHRPTLFCVIVKVLANAIPFYSSAWPADQVLVLCQSYLPRVLATVLGGAGVCVFL